MFGRKKRKPEEVSLVVRSRSLPARVDQEAIEQIRKTDGVISAFIEKRKIERGLVIGKLKTDLVQQATAFERATQAHELAVGERQDIPRIIEKRGLGHEADIEETKTRIARTVAERKQIENPPPPPKESPPPAKPDPTIRMLTVLRQKCRGLTNTARDKEKAKKLIQLVTETEAVAIEDSDPALAGKIREMASGLLDDLETLQSELL